MASVKVGVRVRPFNQREIDLGARLIIRMDGKKTRIYNPKGAPDKNSTTGEHKDFTFDHSYWSFEPDDPHFTSQEEVFKDLGTDVVDSAFEGYNACVFAYGQTGSGKTFTMMGSPENPGLIPRICKSMFDRMMIGKESGTNYRTEVSYLEIYNEKVKDLLQANGSHSLRVREHPVKGPYVQELSTHLVSDYSDIQEWMKRGNIHRTTARTNMNDTSSRSHAIFTITFMQAEFSRYHPTETVSKIHLVDLAGSERADATGATGERLKEGAHINKSLVTLGLVISTLAKLSSNPNDPAMRRSSSFIPYRDSVLTWLLKDSLGGNSKTIMIAAVSPADVNYEETLSTLRYANRAKNIINKPTVNEDPNVTLIRTLREEIAKLKGMLSDQQPQHPQTYVLAQLQEKEAKEKELTEEWTEKWRETRQILEEQSTLGLRKSGVGIILDSARPHLIGIGDDLLSTGVTFYQLKDGETVLGAEEDADICLTGAEIEPIHCSIKLTAGEAWLHPAHNAQCWVNTVPVDKPVRLSQGCIILMGRKNMFRFNDPAEAEQLRKTGSRSQLNLSHFSQIYSSTTDLVDRTSSSENLLEDNFKISQSNTPSPEKELKSQVPYNKNVDTGELLENTEKLQRELTNLEIKRNEKLVSFNEMISSQLSDFNGNIHDLKSSLATLPDSFRDKEKLKKLVATHNEEMQVLEKEIQETKALLKRTLSQRSKQELEEIRDRKVSLSLTLKDGVNNGEDLTPTNDTQLTDSGMGSDPLSTTSEPNGTVGSEIPEDWDGKKQQINELLRIRSFSQSCRQIYETMSMEEAMRAMKILCEKVARQKLLIMQSLEDDCGKEDINQQIADLQDLHRQYVRLEAILEFRKDDIILRDSLPKFQSPVTSPVEPSLSRSLPSIAICNEAEEMPGPWLRIPLFVLRGIGRQAHYEYEIRLRTAEGESFSLLRRYNAFRDLHFYARRRYGPQVEALYFPPKQWLPFNAEGVARKRRLLLETYLLQLIAICSRIRSCPLYNCSDPPSCQQLVQFSNFFRKNVQEESN